jgi:hypothetical protein
VLNGPVITSQFGDRLELAPSQKVQRLNEKSTLDNSRDHQPHRISALEMRKFVSQNRLLQV